MIEPTTWKKIFLTIVCTIAILFFIIAQFLRNADRGIIYVSDRPDLMESCDASCSGWAENHASDYVPIDKAKHLKIAIIQPCLAPSPESIMIQFTLSNAECIKYLAGKTPVQNSVESFIKDPTDPWFSQFGEPPFNRLNWWRPLTARGVSVYKSYSDVNGPYLIVLDPATNRITVLGSAGRGR